jgi:virginiamycin B lyase
MERRIDMTRKDEPRAEAARNKGWIFRRALGAMVVVVALVVGVGGVAWGDASPVLIEFPFYLDHEIAAESDGKLWYARTLLTTPIIGTITAEWRFGQQYPIPSGVLPQDMTLGSDGNIWFTETQTDIIGKISPSGQITEYSLRKGAAPASIVSGSDGNIWFVEPSAKVIAKMNTEGELLAEYILNDVNTDIRQGLVSGPDGNIWFIPTNMNTVVKMSTEGVILASYNTASSSKSLTNGPDGNLWFLAKENYQNYIGKISTSGVVTLYTCAIPAYRIVKGFNNDLWFLGASSSSGIPANLGKISTDGVITIYANIISPYTLSYFIRGPGNAIWFKANDTLWKLVVAPTLESSGKFAIWQNNTTGELRWWNLANSGKIISEAENVGYGKVTSETFGGGAWLFSGAATVGGAKTLFYQNTLNGTVKYLKLDSNATATSIGYVSENLRVNSAWKAVGVKTLNDAPTIIWQNQSSGKSVYWTLNSDATIKNETRGDGWDYVANTLTVGSSWRLSSMTTIGGTNTLLWQNQTSGKIAFWKLDSANKLLNETRDSGWGFVTDSLTLANQWRQVGVINNSSLVWQGQSFGKIAWWQLNESAKLINTNKDSGWGYVSENLKLNSSWTLGAITELGGVKTLIWYNPTTGFVAYWRVNNSIKLPDENKDSGWGYVADDLRMADPWLFNCILE